MRKVPVYSFIIASLLFLVSGCTNIPDEEISLYRKHFAEAHLTGNRLLSEISPFVSLVAKKEGGRSLKDCGLNEHGYPKCFDPRLALQAQSVEEHWSITTRRVALSAVQIYNDLLLDLAEGKQVDRAGQRVRDLSEFVNVLSTGLGIGGPLPGLAAAVGGPALDEFLGAIRAAASAAALRRALVLGAPTVRKLLEALSADTPHMYRIYVAGKDLEFTKRRIQAARNKIRLTRVELAAENRKFHQDLTNYVRVLDATANALTALQAAATTQRLTVAEMTGVIREAANIRIAAETFWKEIDSAR